MAKSEEQNKMIRDQRYEEIGIAALKVFARKGFAATKISDITSESKVSHGLFYHYFQSKEHIYEALIFNVLDMFIEAVKEAEKKSDSPWDQLAWFTEITFAGSLELASDRHLLIIGALKSDLASEEVKQKLVDKYLTAIRGIARIIENGQDKGQFMEGDPMELAVHYISLSQGLTLWNARGFYPIEFSIDKVLQHLKQ